MADRKRVVITLEAGGMFDSVFQPDTLADLGKHADVLLNDLGRRMSTEELTERAKDADAIVTAWGTPGIDPELPGKAPGVKFIGHAAGSIKRTYPPELWDAGVTITNAGSAIAKYVGEFTLLAALALLRTLPKYTPGAPTEAWNSIPSDSWSTLFGKTVGLVGLGNTAKAFLRVLAPFECDVIAYDPYLAPAKAQEYGVRLTTLEEVLSTSDVVSVHAPITDETKGMLNSGNLKLIKDGACFINTARGILIDHDALTEELKTGRFKAALDVTTPEPLPEDHPLRKLPNVLITPHVAGPTIDGRRDLGQCVVDDLKLFWEGKTPTNLVTKQMLKTMA